jgi:TP901 family phage tail tape measure protein
MATASDLTSGLSSVIQGLGRAMRTTGTLMTVGAGVAGAALFSLSQRAEQVSTAFREVDTLVQGTANAQEKYGELVSDLNTEMGLQADRLEVIEGLYQSISAGVDQSEEAQRTFMSTASKLAVVGRVELGTAVDVLSTVMNTYGMEASQAENVSESLFQTVQFGKTRMEDLAPVLGRVAALGSNLGVKIDEIGASMGVLTRTGFGARVAATGLRNIFRSMLKPSEQMQTALFDIASEQNFFASQFDESSEKIKGIAQNFRDARDAVEKYTKEQKEARAVQERSSTVIQEARLKMEAIDEDRLDQLPELTSKTVKQAESVEELESVIDDYQFKVNKARLEEKQARKNREEASSEVSNYKSEIADLIATSGDLEGGIGQLVLENQNFVDTITDLREHVNNTDKSMSDLFPRTRALQGALALVGEDGQMLTDIFEQMEEPAFDARDAWNELDESARNNFESFQDFKKATDDVEAGDLDKWFQEATGPSQKLRNSISELQESLGSLGSVFTEDLVGTISTFADNVNSLTERFSNMEESLRENISQFSTLAISIGLVLGPLLFFGGQLAVMASIMGSTFIPFLAIIGILMGGFASALRDVTSGGESAESTLSSLSEFLSTLIFNLRTAWFWFGQKVLPELKELGGLSFGIFRDVASNLQLMGGEGQVAADRIHSLMSAIGGSMDAVNAFIKQNRALIVTVLTFLGNFLINNVIPAFVLLGRTIAKLASDIDWTPFIILGGIVASIVAALLRLATVILRVINVLSPVLAPIISWIALFGVLIVSIMKISAAVSSFIVLATSLGSIMQLVVFIISTVNSVMATMGIAVAALSSLFTIMVSAVSTLASAFAFLAGAISLPMLLIGGLILLLGVIAAAAWIARDELVAAWQDIKEMIVTILQSIWKALTGQISWKQAGRNIIVALVDGLLSAKGHLRDALDTVANTFKDHLGFGSSPDAYGPEFNPANWGGNSVESFAVGAEEEIPEVKSSAKGISEAYKSNIDTDIQAKSPADTISEEIDNRNAFNRRDRPSATDLESMGGIGAGGSEITIEEKAVFFESGAFEGVSDEELPRKVRDVVDNSMDEIVEDLEAKGVEFE